MLIKTGNSAFIHPVPGEITPAHVYQSRREVMRLAVTGVAGAAMAAWAARDALAQASTSVQRPGKLAALASSKSGVAGALAM